MKYLPPLKSLQFFYMAAQYQSFKLAADKLNVSQAAVSQQIRQLEEYLGCKLFERNAKSTRLTEYGCRMLPFIAKGFDELTLGVQSVTGDPRPNILRISTLHSFTSLWLIPRLQEFQKLHPDIMVQLAPSNDLVTFNESEIDLAIRMGRGGYKGLTEKKILNDNLVFVASPKILKGVNHNDIQQIFNLPWIEDTTSGIQSNFEAFCQTHHINRDKLVPVIKTNNAAPLIESAVDGQGFLMVNHSLVVDHIRSGRLKTLLNYKTQSPYSLYLVAPAQQFQWKKVRLFEQWFTPKVLESFDDLDKW